MYFFKKIKFLTWYYKKRTLALVVSIKSEKDNILTVNSVHVLHQSKLGSFVFIPIFKNIKEFHSNYIP